MPVRTVRVAVTAQNDGARARATATYRVRHPWWQFWWWL